MLCGFFIALIYLLPAAYNENNAFCFLFLQNVCLQPTNCFRTSINLFAGADFIFYPNMAFKIEFTFEL